MKYFPTDKNIAKIDVLIRGYPLGEKGVYIFLKILQLRGLTVCYFQANLKTGKVTDRFLLQNTDHIKALATYTKNSSFVLICECCIALNVI